MGAARGKRLEVACLRMNQQSRFAAELKDLSGVPRYLSGLACDDRILLCLNALRRDHESEDRVKDRCERGEGACSQKVVDEPPSRESRGQPRVVVTVHHLFSGVKQKGRASFELALLLIYAVSFFRDCLR